MTKLAPFLLLLIVRIQASDPRKRFHGDFFVTDDQYLRNNGLEYLEHKRFGTEDTEPFWANRGKKDPTYLKEPFLVDEPYWILVRRNERLDDDPFFVSRGKKETSSYNMKKKFLNDYSPDVESENPFHAARGKKEYDEKMKD